MADDNKYYAPGDARILGWCREAIQEGERINKSDPTYAKMDSQIAYAMGDQLSGIGGADSPTYLSKVIVNLTKKAINQHASALTDLSPSFAFRTANPRYNDAAEVLNQYVKIWWVNGFVDKELLKAIQYSACCGSGDVITEYDPNFLGGDSRLLVRDPRDTLPIRPEKDANIQDWEGVIIRESHSVNKLLAKYPEKSYCIKPDSGSYQNIFSRFLRAMQGLTGPVTTLSGLGDKDPNRKFRGSAIPEVTTYRLHVQDRTLNFSDREIVMGAPGTNWAYSVPPGSPLYPRGRLIILTEHGILDDTVNPYWHAKYPVSRLQLQPWPWLFFGMPILNDLIGVQNGVNTVINNFLQLLSQTVNRGTFWDRSMPTNIRQRFDPRRPNWKVQRPNNFSDGMKLAEVPQMPPWALDFLAVLDNKFSDIAGTANLQQLLSLRQVPSGDTLEKYAEALTPEIRMEGRSIEYFLRDIATMIKGNLFQYQSTSKRFVVLGDAANTMEVLDFDPATLIPGMKEGEDGYVKELDASIPRSKRAEFFLTQFSFMVAPNSMLAFNASEKKMMYLQLARAGYMDIWSLMEVLQIPNAGTPPKIPLPANDQPVIIAPGVELRMELRDPRTVTERLIAQQQLGIGQQANPAGRKASGQEPPHMVQKSDGSSTIAES